MHSTVEDMFNIRVNENHSSIVSQTPFINTNEDLAVYCEVIKSRKVIALDTEFLRVNTFYPIPGLFQLNDGENIVLIDPCVITEWEGFKSILTDKKIVKVFHACDEDIELLYHFLNVEPQSVFDTQVAAAFCGYDFCMGYQRLIKAMLDIDLEKTSSRSDWMQRPLTQKQIEYAVDDVRYLLPIYHLLFNMLEKRNLHYIIEEEYEFVLQNIKSTEFDQAYTRIKESWKLNSKAVCYNQSFSYMARENDERKGFAKKKKLRAMKLYII